MYIQCQNTYIGWDQEEIMPYMYLHVCIYCIDTTLYQHQQTPWCKDAGALKKINYSGKGLTNLQLSLNCFTMLLIFSNLWTSLCSLLTECAMTCMSETEKSKEGEGGGEEMIAICKYVILRWPLVEKQEHLSMMWLNDQLCLFQTSLQLLMFPIYYNYNHQQDV